ncbi:hypothetical protein EDC04DRAFT_2604127 [Pisolithus marmoratus]|nr:hypothetical protein EDC04DRAFT_2604127 [Pisolithus marmoratus]
MDMVHMSSLLHGYERSQWYTAWDFLCIARFQATATIGACNLYHIPSQSSCYHEFLLVHMDTGDKPVDCIIVHDGNTMSTGRGWSKPLLLVFQSYTCCYGKGVTSFSGKWFPWFGKFKPSHVQLLVKLHADYYQYFYPPANHQAPLAPTMENEQHAPLIVIPNIIHGLATFIAQLMLPDPETCMVMGPEKYEHAFPWWSDLMIITQYIIIIPLYG